MHKQRLGGQHWVHRYSAPGTCDVRITRADSVRLDDGELKKQPKQTPQVAARRLWSERQPTHRSRAQQHHLSRLCKWLWVISLGSSCRLTITGAHPLGSSAGAAFALKIRWQKNVKNSHFYERFCMFACAFAWLHDTDKAHFDPILPGFFDFPTFDIQFMWHSRKLTEGLPSLLTVN
jgi:hypothetical protein